MTKRKSLPFMIPTLQAAFDKVNELSKHAIENARQALREVPHHTFKSTGDLDAFFRRRYDEYPGLLEADEEWGYYFDLWQGLARGLFFVCKAIGPPSESIRERVSEEDEEEKKDPRAEWWSWFDSMSSWANGECD